jgi:hypothetical protein
MVGGRGAGAIGCGRWPTIHQPSPLATSAGLTGVPN